MAPVSFENNQAFVLRSESNANVEPWPITKTTPGPNEVLLKTLTVGICGSDVHYWKRMRCSNFIVKEPMVLGHESCAEVIQVGPGVKNLKVGDRVCPEPAVPCRTCSFCRSDKYNLCVDMACHATPPYHGSLTNYFLHAADYCFKVPDNVSNEEAAMVEPMSVAVHACKRSQVTIGSLVLVTGAGPIGLYSVMVAKAYGASRVVVTDINAERLKLAKELGADESILVTKDKSEEQLVEAVLKALNGSRPSVSIECSGAFPSVRLSMLSTESGGTVVLVGMGASEMNLPIADAASREVTILGAFRYKNCFPIALDLASSGKLQLKKLISHRFDFQDCIKAFQTAHDGIGIKVIIKVSD